MAEGDDRLKEALKAKREMEALTSLPGWNRLRVLVEEQVRVRTNLVMLQPLGKNNLSSSEQEFMKGEVAAFRSILAMPETVIEASRGVIQIVKGEDEDGR